MSDPDLEAAYALETPQDNRALYASWARSYDSDFVAEMDYQLPAHVVRQFRELWLGDASARVLDIGAGTGIIGQLLSGSGLLVDGLDISPEMLAVAGEKQAYANLIEADLTQHLNIASGTYDAVVSAGTFTHGHVGPEALDELIRVAKPGAVCVLAVNDAHFTGQGFAAKLQALADQIIAPDQKTVRIYGPGADHAHADDLGRLVSFTTV